MGSAKGMRAFQNHGSVGGEPHNCETQAQKQPSATGARARGSSGCRGCRTIPTIVLTRPTWRLKHPVKSALAGVLTDESMTAGLVVPVQESGVMVFGQKSHRNIAGPSRSKRASRPQIVHPHRFTPISSKASLLRCPPCCREANGRLLQQTIQ